MLLLALLACTAKDSDDTGTPGDSASGDSGDSAETGDSGETGDTGETGDSAETGDTAVTLADVRDEMDRSADGCENLGDTPTSGAARYFWGEYTGDAKTGWTGTEAVYLFANATWKAAGQEDCVGLWTATAVTASTGACPTCEVGMIATATYDVVNSTCPIELYGDDFVENYGLDEDAAGTVRWYYARSGNVMGDGYWAGDGANFLSTRGCVWF